MSSWEILLGIILGLAVNESCDLSPWLAKKVVRWSARMQYGKSERAKIRAAELVSLIEERPGKLFKLATALGFAIAALMPLIRRRANDLAYEAGRRASNLLLGGRRPLRWLPSWIGVPLVRMALTMVFGERAPEDVATIFWHNKSSINIEGQASSRP